MRDRYQGIIVGTPVVEHVSKAVVRLRRKASEFEEWWEERHEEDPSHYPLELDEYEWARQFRIWMGWEEEYPDE